MRKIWFSPNIVLNGLFWIVGLAMQIGGWVSQPIAYVLLGIALLWSMLTVVYWRRNKGTQRENESPSSKQRGKRTGIRMKGGKGDFKDTTISCQDTAIDIEDTNLKLKDTDIK